jgi:hypothetical protein
MPLLQKGHSTPELDRDPGGQPRYSTDHWSSVLDLAQAWKLKAKILPKVREQRKKYFPPKAILDTS